MGFIGSNFIRQVLERGDCSIVTNLDALKYGSNTANLDGIEDERYNFVEGDISDRALVSELVRRAKRPILSALENMRVDDLGLEMRGWEDVFRNYLDGEA